MKKEKIAISPFISLAICLFPYVSLLLPYIIPFEHPGEEMFGLISLFLIYGVYFFITSLIVAVIGLIFEKNKRFNKLNWISVVISGLTSLMFLLMYLGIG